jgi:sugar/nucleoside kinase (ribokinase family)
MRSSRLVLVGGILVDIVLGVEAVPQPGGDVLAPSSTLAVGGDFNVLQAARRQDMPAAFGGRVGDGPFGRRVLDALDAAGVVSLRPPTPEGDTGFCVVMVDSSGERTMVTAMGVEARLRPEDLSDVALIESDTVYVSGYDLAYPHGPVIVQWIADVAARVEVIFDPGPLVRDLPASLLEATLASATWISLNQREAEVLTGEPDAATAAAVLLERGTRLRGAIVRGGPAGCFLAMPGTPTVEVPAFRADPVDTTGAGDTHVGTFVAALARGERPADACVWANAAASVAVSRWGPAAAPEYDVTARLVAGRPGPHA